MTDSIDAMLPHAGAMVLIDEVVRYDEQQIHCRAQIGGLANHPLARDGVLPSAELVEYAAQAMALHGALTADPGDPILMGRLAALPTLELIGDRVDAPATLDVHVQREGGDGSGALYVFRVLSDQRTLASGRATVMFVNSVGGP